MSYVESTIYISCGQLDAYYGLYEARHYSSTGSYSRYMSNPEKEHWRVAKLISRYLKGSSDMTLCYDGTDVRLHEYIDSDFAGNVDSRKSTTGYVFMLCGCLGCKR